MKAKLLITLLFIASVELWAQTDTLTIGTLKDTISIVAVGDMMIGSGFPEGHLPKDDARKSFKYVKNFLKGDVVFGNLEGVLLDRGDSDKCKKCKDVERKETVLIEKNKEFYKKEEDKPITDKEKEEESCYVFRMPERYGKIIKEAGFNLLSTANNHANDFGYIGRKTTAKVLDKVGIQHAGPVEKKSVVFEKEGVKYGFCAFSPNANMLTVNNIKRETTLVQQLRTQANIVIVSFHGGAEGAPYTRVPRDKEVFYGENRGDVYKFAHSVIDAGADVVLGHGPHVTRAVELYKNKFIAYSLGNFNTYGRFSLKGLKGIAPLLDIKLNNKGDFLYAKVVPIKQTKAAGLRLDNDCKAFEELKRLTRLDFPETALKFEGDFILKADDALVENK